MLVRTIESKNNARLKELRRALGTAGRGTSRLVDGARRLVGIEGPNLIEEALRAGVRVATIFVAIGAEHSLDWLPFPCETEVLRLKRELLDSALATETPQPLAALVEPPDWTWADVIRNRPNAALIVILAGIQDPGNLGTILRSAEAFGASGIVSLPGTVSTWNPKAVRASAGSVFRVPVIASNAEECFARLREGGAKILATMARGGKAADSVNLADSVALVIGNEGNGVPQGLARQCDGAITIHSPGPVESLNAAVAASVLLYEAARQRATASGGKRGRRGARR